MAQRILKKQFPNVNGLHLTLLQNKECSYSVSNAIQIFHVQGNHWVCATRPANKQVLVYDSAYTKWGEKSLSPIMKQFRCAMGRICIVNGSTKAVW